MKKTLTTTVLLCLLLLMTGTVVLAQYVKYTPDPADVSAGYVDPVISNWGSDQVVWVTQPSGSPFCRAASGMIGHYVYHFGSEATNSAQAFDANTNTWVPSTPCPSGYDNWDGAVANDVLYVVGRYDGLYHNDFYRFTPTEGGPIGTWATMAPFPQSLTGVCLVWDGGEYLYASGGDATLPIAYRYDIAGNAWTAIPNMPGPMRYAGGAFCDGKFHIIGGIIGTGNLHYAYDPVTNAWQTLAPVPVVPWFALFSTTGNDQYVISIGGGGGYASWPATSAVQLYDPTTDTWFQETPLPSAAGNNSGNWLGSGFRTGGALSAGGYNGGQVGTTYRGSGMPGGAPPGSPAAPSNLIVEDNGATLIASLSWTNPTTTMSGHPLTTIDSVVVLRNDVMVLFFAPSTPGQSMQWDDNTISQAGIYSYAVYCVNSEGAGSRANASAWIGPDVPHDVNNLLLTPAANHALEATLTWINPSSGAHGGFYPGITGYTILRDSEEGFSEVFDLPGEHTSFDDEDVPDPDYYWYTVIPYNASGEGLSAVSNIAWVGPPEIWIWEQIPYEWNDISSYGTNAGITGDDENVGPFDLGFNFTFFGNSFNSIRICSNGWQSFTSTSTTYVNASIPNTAEPNNLIASFWDDLYPPGGGAVYYYQDQIDGRFIIQYDISNATFQVVLDSHDGSISVYYNNITINSSCTVGIENDNGTHGPQVCYNGAGAFLPTGSTAIRFMPPVPIPTGSLEGYVYENQPPNEPIEGARVVILADTGYTDATGFYHIDGIYTGQHNAHAAAFGYNIVTEPVLIAADSLTTQDFYLPQPLIDVDVTSIDVAVPASTPHEVDFNIANLGDGSLEFSIRIVGGGHRTDSNSKVQDSGFNSAAFDDTDDPWIWVNPDEGTIESGESQAITVSFMMPDSGELGDTYHADLVIDNNTIIPQIMIPVEVTIVAMLPASDELLPRVYALHQNHPNPFNPTTTLSFDLPEQTFVVMTLHNVLGQKVATVLNRTMDAGRHSTSFDASELASGLYFCRFTAGEFTGYRKLVLIR